MRACTFLAVFALSWIGLAQAQADKVAFSGAYWIHTAYTSDFPLAEDDAVWLGQVWPDGIRDGLKLIAEHRLRLRVEEKISGSLKLVASGDIAGTVAGDTTFIGKDYLLVPRDDVRFYNRSTLREAYLEWLSPIGLFRVGQMTSAWGLGIVANDGADVEGAFHHPLLGDLVERVLFVTRPAQPFSESLFAQHFHLGFGGDLVYRDDMASLLDGDIAAEGIALLFFDGPVVKGGDDLFAGIYAAYRYQSMEDKDKLRVLVLDGAFRHKMILDSRGSYLQIEGEGVYVYGSLSFHDRAGPPRAPDGVDIRQWGAVLRGKGYIPDAGLELGVETGVASGDNDQLDSVARAFRFDPDYQVGMILFQEVLGRMSALQPERVSDPHLLFKPPSGYKTAATNGSITNAVYVNPKVRYWPHPNVEMLLGFLWARALAPVAGPYNTAGHGGYPLGYRVNPLKWKGGEWKERDLGIEVDGGLAYAFRSRGGEVLRLGAQGGWFRPGTAFNDAEGRRMNSVYKFRILVDLTW